jgi:hypothetical protein
MPDIQVSDQGSIVLFYPSTAEGRAWWRDNVQAAPMFGPAYAVEHRYAGDIIEGAQADGLTVEGA